MVGGSGEEERRSRRAPALEKKEIHVAVTTVT
jgi:hypothetical protein